MIYIITCIYKLYNTYQICIINKVKTQYKRHKLTDVDYRVSPSKDNIENVRAIDKNRHDEENNLTSMNCMFHVISR